MKVIKGKSKEEAEEKANDKAKVESAANGRIISINTGGNWPEVDKQIFSRYRRYLMYAQCKTFPFLADFFWSLMLNFSRHILLDIDNLLCPKV